MNKGGVGCWVLGVGNQTTDDRRPTVCRGKFVFDVALDVILRESHHRRIRLCVTLRWAPESLTIRLPQNDVKGNAKSQRARVIERFQRVTRVSLPNTNHPTLNTEVPACR